jgi:hypothetical protein
MKPIINFFKSLFLSKKEELPRINLLPIEDKKEEMFCETVKKEVAPKAKRGRKPKTEKAIGKEVKAPAKKSKKSEN